MEINKENIEKAIQLSYNASDVVVKIDELPKDKLKTVAVSLVLHCKNGLHTVDLSNEKATFDYFTLRVFEALRENEIGIEFVHDEFKKAYAQFLKNAPLKVQVMDALKSLGMEAGEIDGGIEIHHADLLKNLSDLKTKLPQKAYDIVMNAITIALATRKAAEKITLFDGLDEKLTNALSMQCQTIAQEGILEATEEIEKKVSNPEIKFQMLDKYFDYCVMRACANIKLPSKLIAAEYRATVEAMKVQQFS